MRATLPGRVLLCLALVLAAVGCGSYRIRYRLPSRAPSGLTTTRQHAHGMGLIGGGGYFFVLHQMFPALVDYTGPVDLNAECPGGFSEISHYHSFGQNAGAAFLSWVLLLNAYHESNVEIQHAGGRATSRDRPTVYGRGSGG